MKRGLIFIIFLMLVMTVTAEDNITLEDAYSDIGDVELTGSAGLTPDSYLQFIDQLIETRCIGDRPENALD